MAKYSKFNIIYRLQKWMESVAGQTFMNYAYSWGASVVILGTLFKLTHLPGANLMLYIGMGTEVFVFFIAAFDRPFDKTSDGRELATDSQLAAESGDDDENSNEAYAPAIGTVSTQTIASTPSSGIIAGGSGVVSGGTVIINGVAGEPVQVGGAYSTAENTDIENSGQGLVANAGGTIPASGISIGAPAPAVTQETAVAMEEATTTYVDRLNELNELLLKVGAQSERLTTDSEEMENLNRTLCGIARIYEIQLKAASQQINTQEEINEQTRTLAQKITELNAIYSRMIEAMSVNVKAV